MWDFVKIIGDIDGSSLRVRLPTGEEMFAPMVTSLGLPLPSQKWIDNNKDSFLAILQYQENLNPEPIVVGFYPVKGAESDKFSIFERLLKVNLEVIELLAVARIATQLGPQPFMADSQEKIVNIKKEIQELIENVLPIKK